MRSAISTTLLLSGFLLSGCVKPPPVSTPETPVEPPDAWTAEQTDPGPIDGEWWSSFSDDSLNKLIPIALADVARPEMYVMAMLPQALSRARTQST